MGQKREPATGVFEIRNAGRHAGNMEALSSQDPMERGRGDLAARYRSVAEASDYYYVAVVNLEGGGGGNDR